MSIKPPSFLRIIRVIMQCSYILAIVTVLAYQLVSYTVMPATAAVVTEELKYSYIATVVGVRLH